MDTLSESTPAVPARSRTFHIKLSEADFERLLRATAADCRVGRRIGVSTTAARILSEALAAQVAP